MKKSDSFDMLGMALHTNLRKFCDSTITSLTWNLVQDLGVEWVKYLQFANEELLKDSDYVASLKRAAQRYEEVGETFKERCLYLTFHLFSDADWEGFAAYLEHLYKEQADA